MSSLRMVPTVRPIQVNAALEEIVKGAVFGEVRYYTLIVEFQKRGLPHVHMLIQLCDSPKEARPCPSLLAAAHFHRGRTTLPYAVLSHTSATHQPHTSDA